MALPGNPWKITAAFCAERGRSLHSSSYLAPLQSSYHTATFSSNFMGHSKAHCDYPPFLAQEAKERPKGPVSEKERGKERPKVEPPGHTFENLPGHPEG